MHTTVYTDPNMSLRNASCAWHLQTDVGSLNGTSLNGMAVGREYRKVGLFLACLPLFSQRLQHCFCCLFRLQSPIQLLSRHAVTSSSCCAVPSSALTPQGPSTSLFPLPAVPALPSPVPMPALLCFWCGASGCACNILCSYLMFITCCSLRKTREETHLARALIVIPVPCLFNCRV